MEKKFVLPSPKFLPSSLKSQISILSPTPSPRTILMPGLVSTNFGSQNSFKKSEKDFKTPAPVPNNNAPARNIGTPHFSSPDGMLMPSHMQPPPMYGPRGPTIPPKYMHHNNNYENRRRFLCETCDKDFLSYPELMSHKSEHRKCGVDGCTFTGDPSIIASHIEHTHTSGLYNKIKKLSTPEEVAKWREERRKRYPTRANIELRQKAQEERFKRGEKLGKKNNRFGNKHERRPIRNNDQANQRVVLRKPSEFSSQNSKKREDHRPTEKTKREEDVCKPTVDEEEFKGNLPRFKGTSKLEGFDKENTKSIEINPLAKLLGMYGSDDETDSSDDEEDGPENENVDSSNNKSGHKTTDILLNTEHPYNKPSDELLTTTIAPENSLKHENCTNLLEQAKKAEEPSQSEIKVRVSQQSDSSGSSDNEMPEEVPIERQPADSEIVQNNVCVNENTKTNMQEKSEDLNLSKEKSEQPKQTSAATHKSDNHRKRNRRKRGAKSGDTPVEPERKKFKKKGLLDYSKLRTRRQNTMLEKLLEPDIIHERNVILQCIKYVVENDFFGIGSKTSS